MNLQAHHVIYKKGPDEVVAGNPNGIPPMRARWHKCESRWHMQIPGKRYMVDDGFVVMKAGKLSKKGTNTCCVCSAIFCTETWEWVECGMCIYVFVVILQVQYTIFGPELMFVIQ